MSDESELSRLVNELRSQLQAVERNAGNDPMFTVTGCELEIGVSRLSEGSGGLTFYLFEVGGKASKENSSVLRLQLQPLREVYALAADGARKDEPTWIVEPPHG